jgi:hypothetical protein
MTRKKLVPHAFIDELLDNRSRTTVMAACVCAYDELRILEGPSFDLDLMENIFISNKDISIYDEKQFVPLENPTANDFREAILSYVHSLSARGDILLLYFSGHGAVLQNGGFAFCFSDTRCGYEGGGVYPLSIVSFQDVISTLASVDVHPIFIIDACFSGVTAPQGYSNVSSSMQTELEYLSNSYGLLSAASSVSTAIDTSSGGVFTQVLSTLLCNGLSEEPLRQFPLLTLNHISSPLQDELTKLGQPLPRYQVGRLCPPIPLSRNLKFRPDAISFSPIMKRIVELLWNSADVMELTKANIGKKIGQGAYANHNKLSLPPWALVEDGDAPKTRRLTSKGKSFASSEVKIPKKIIRDPLSGRWIPAPGSERVLISDI